MGWEYELPLTFAQPAPPAIRFQQLARFMKDKTHIWESLRRIDVYHRRFLPEDEVGRFEFKSSSPENVEEFIAQLPEKFAGEDYLIRGAWGVTRYFPLSPDPPAITSESQPSGVTIVAIGDDFRWQNILPRPKSLVIYDAGDSRRYHVPARKHLAAQNLELLITELTTLIEFGVTTMRGLDGDAEEDPRLHSLCYHANLSDFGSDLSHFANRPVVAPVTPEVIAQAASRCEQIKVISIGEGRLVYHTHGVAGSLHDFYEALLAQVT